jgi:calcineurin-like phosphoesterase family protein
MNEELIKRWNAVVKKGDIIYHLGDFAWRGVPGTVTDVESILQRLNGQKFLIIGTHDAEAIRLRKYWCQQILMKEVDIDGQHIVMGHYAQRVWSRSHFGSLHLFGHSHNHLPPYGKSFDIGVDTCYGEGHVPYSPYSWDEVKKVMESLHDNWVDTRYEKSEEDEEDFLN